MKCFGYQILIIRTSTTLNYKTLFLKKNCSFCNFFTRRKLDDYH